jgi:hypothetical protein
MAVHRPAPNSAAVLEAKRAGASVRTISERLGCSVSAARKVLTAAGLAKGSGGGEYVDPTRAELVKWCREHLSDLRKEHGNV